LRAAGENFQAFFVLFCKFLVNWGENMHTFYQLGKNMHFPPFLSPFNNFFSQPVIWPYFCLPPFLIYIFPQPKFIIMRECAPQVNNFQHTFHQLGKDICISPFFLSPFNNFFPQPVISPNKKIYTPAILVKVQIQLITTIVNITVRFIIDSF